MTPAQKAAAQAIARDLYRVMPTGTVLPKEGTVELWGEVDDCPEFLFCERIAEHIVRNSGATFVDRD